MPYYVYDQKWRSAFCSFCGQHIKEPNDSSRNEYNVFFQEHFKDLREAK